MPLCSHPLVGALYTVFQRPARSPPQLFLDQSVVGVPSADPGWARNVPDRQFLSRYVHDQFCQIIDAYHLIRSDVYGPVQRIGSGESSPRCIRRHRGMNESACRLPDFDRPASSASATFRTRLPAPFPFHCSRSPPRQKYCVTGNAHLHSMIARVGQVKPFGEELLPPIFTVRIRRIGRILRTFGLSDQADCVRIHARG